MSLLHTSEAFLKEWNTKNHVMIDMETLATNELPVIPQISAVQFNPWTGDIYQKFDIKISMQSMLDAGLSIDESTFRFWMSQNQDVARKILTPAQHETVSINEAMLRLSSFVKACSSNNFTCDTRIWGKGPSFDCAKLSNVYRKLILPQPWQYWNERCVRTINALNPVLVKSIEFVGDKHDGIDDSKHQVKTVSQTLRSVFDIISNQQS